MMRHHAPGTAAMEDLPCGGIEVGEWCRWQMARCMRPGRAPRLCHTSCSWDRRRRPPRRLLCWARPPRRRQAEAARQLSRHHPTLPAHKAPLPRRNNRMACRKKPPPHHSRHLEQNRRRRTFTGWQRRQLRKSCHSAVPAASRSSYQQVSRRFSSRNGCTTDEICSHARAIRLTHRGFRTDGHCCTHRCCATGRHADRPAAARPAGNPGTGSRYAVRLGCRASSHATAGSGQRGGRDACLLAA